MSASTTPATQEDLQRLEERLRSALGVAAPASAMLPPQKTGFWESDWTKAIVILVALVGAVWGATSYFDDRARTISEHGDGIVLEKYESLARDVAYLRQTADKHTEDLSEIKASLARLEARSEPAKK